MTGNNGDISNVRTVESAEFASGNGYVTDLSSETPAGFKVRLSAGSESRIITSPDGTSYVLVSRSKSGNIFVSTSTTLTDPTKPVTAADLGPFPLDPALVLPVVNSYIAENAPAPAAKAFAPALSATTILLALTQPMSDAISTVSAIFTPKGA